VLALVGFRGRNYADVMPIERIVSGGQTGVDRAALDVAQELGIPCGGWCPRGRKAEDGRIPRRYPLRESPSARYAQRTRWNVRDSDGTLILALGELTGGTALTLKAAQSLGRPVFVVDLSHSRAVVPVRKWLQKFGIGVLNVAGPRESTQEGAYLKAYQFLRRLLRPAAESPAAGRAWAAASPPAAIRRARRSGL
jgi:hypothetical protein